MKYYEWWGDPYAVDIEFPERHFRRMWWMRECRPVTGWDDSLVATYDTDAVLSSNFGLAGNSWPVASSAVRSLLERNASELVQFLPFRLQRPDASGEARGYSVVQLLKCVDCLDLERTTVEDGWKPINSFGDFKTLRPFIFKRPLIGGNKLFRSLGNSHIVVIREDLKETIEDAGFLDQRFDLVECSE